MAGKKGNPESIPVPIDKSMMVKVRFLHLEMPGTRLDFVYQGEDFHLKHGKEYTLPLEVVEHLNSITVPDPHFYVDEETGQLQHDKTAYRNRFNCQIVDLKGMLGQAKTPNKEEKQHLGELSLSK